MGRGGGAVERGGGAAARGLRGQVIVMNIYSSHLMDWTRTFMLLVTYFCRRYLLWSNCVLDTVLTREIQDGHM